MALYNWTKYSASQKTNYIPQFEYSMDMDDSGEPFSTSYTATDSRFEQSGTRIDAGAPVSNGSVFYHGWQLFSGGAGYFRKLINIGQPNGVHRWQVYNYSSYYTSTSYTRGSVIQSNIQATQNAFTIGSASSVHSDGYWYERGSAIAPTWGAVPSMNTNKGSTRSIDLSSYVTDPSSDSITFSIATAPNSSIATASLSGSTLTITGRGEGITNLVVRASNAAASSTLTIYSVITDPVPVWSNIPTQTISGKGFSTNVTLSSYITDPNNEPITFTASSNTTSVVTTAVSNSVLTLHGVKKGSATITVIATNKSGYSSSKTFPVNVLNTSPTWRLISSQNISDVGNTKTLTLSDYASDNDGDSLTYSATSSKTSVATVSVSGSVLTMRSVATGNTTITVTANDGTTSSSRTFNLTVNRPPVWAKIPEQNILQGGYTNVVNLGNYASDPNGDSLTYTAASSNGSIVKASISSGNVVLDAYKKGQVTITVTVSDGFDTATTTFITKVGNKLPVWSAIPLQTLYREKLPTVINLRSFITEIDDDLLTFSVIGNTNPECVNATITGNNLNLSGLLKGTSELTLSVHDSVGAVTTKLNVVTANTKPLYASVIGNKSFKVENVQTIDLAQHFSDINSEDKLTYSVVSSNPTNVEATIKDSIVTLTGKRKGASTITVTANDGDGGITTGNFTATIINSAPSIPPDITFNVPVIRPTSSVVFSIAPSTDANTEDILSYELDYSYDSNQTYTPIGNLSTTRERNLTIGSSKTARSINLRARAYDGTVYSAYVYKSFKINQAPTNPTVITVMDIAGLESRKLNPVRVEGSTDINNDPISYEISYERNETGIWEVVSTSQDTLSQIMIPGKTTRIRFRARAFDGLDYSQSYIYTTTYNVHDNSPPTISVKRKDNNASIINGTNLIFIDGQKQLDLIFQVNDSDEEENLRYEIYWNNVKVVNETPTEKLAEVEYSLKWEDMVLGTNTFTIRAIDIANEITDHTITVRNLVPNGISIQSVGDLVRAEGSTITKFGSLNDIKPPSYSKSTISLNEIIQYLL